MGIWTVRKSMVVRLACAPPHANSVCHPAQTTETRDTLITREGGTTCKDVANATTTADGSEIVAVAAILAFERYTVRHIGLAAKPAPTQDIRPSTQAILPIYPLTPITTANRGL